MRQTFESLKAAAKDAASTVELFRVAKASNDKLLLNIGRVQMLSYTHGRAPEADYYFNEVIPGWQRINNEIHQMLATAMNGKSAEEVVAIITEATN